MSISISFVSGVLGKYLFQIWLTDKYLKLKLSQLRLSGYYRMTKSIVSGSRLPNIYLLCDLGQVTYPLNASFFSL
jgi:hypothetical protein